MRTTRRMFALLASALLGVVWVVYSNQTDPRWFPVEPLALERTEGGAEPITPLPLSVPLDRRKVALGRRLFHEPQLSGDGSVSCAHCHSLASGGVDRLARSRGIGGKEGGINAPTVFNSGLNFRQFWNGRAASLEDQIDGSLEAPSEMGSSWPLAIARLSRDRSYLLEFVPLYPDGVQPRNVKDAIATFERSLLTPNSRFDRFLRGQALALNEEELAGYRLFKQLGCSSCHQGVNVGGNMYQKLGIVEDYFKARSGIGEADLGRFSITRREEDHDVFKVPSLRNVALTPPYLHDGSAVTLEDAIQVMARYELGERPTARDVKMVAAFLRTLTGEYDGRPLE